VVSTHHRVLSRSLVAASGENVQVSRSAREQEIVVAGFWARQNGREEQFGKNRSQITGIKFNN
jgi:hypothetical protein